MLASTSFLECTVYVGFMAVVVWLFSLVEPLSDRVFGWLGRATKRAFRGTRVASSPELDTPDMAAVLEEAKGYHSDKLHLVACLAKFAKIDGVVTKNEIAVVEEIFGFMSLAGEARQAGIQAFQHAKQGRASLQACVQLCAEWHREDPRWVQAIIVLFFKVAHADGEPNVRTQQTLEAVCGWLKLDYQEGVRLYEQSRHASDHSPDDLGAAYAVLGCQPTDTLNVVKDRYRKLVKDYHPDTLSGKNLAPDFLRFAEERFKQIQAAYEAILAARGATAN